MSEGEKLLLSLFVVIIASLGVPVIYLIYRAYKLAKLRMYLERERSYE